MNTYNLRGLRVESLPWSFFFATRFRPGHMLILDDLRPCGMTIYSTIMSCVVGAPVRCQTNCACLGKKKLSRDSHQK
jgi:hypothetical protein